MANPLVVLLHGVGLDHRMWRPVAALLQDEFDVLTPDLLGHGSNAPAADGTTLRDLADDVARSVAGAARTWSASRWARSSPSTSPATGPSWSRA